MGERKGKVDEKIIQMYYVYVSTLHNTCVCYVLQLYPNKKGKFFFPKKNKIVLMILTFLLHN